MGHGGLHCGRNIDDGLVVGSGLPYVQHRVADFQRVLHLGAVETLRAVLEGEIALGLVCQTLQEHGSVHRQLLDLFFALFENLLPLRDGDGVVEVHHRVGRALYRLESLLYNMLSRLGQHLDGHVLGNHVMLDQSADEIEFCLGSRRKTHLNFLEADLHQHAGRTPAFPPGSWAR